MLVALFALGLVLVVEGLALALLPGRLEDLVALIAKVSLHQRRALGLGALALGVGLIWVARSALGG